MPTEKKLRMTLQEIRDAINLEKENWENMYSTNCYAYALGLDIPQYEIKDYAYAPGVIGNSEIYLPHYSTFLYEDLLNNIYLDLKALKLEFKEVNPLERVKENEWKIALYVAATDKAIFDYHFLRQHSDGIWYHKNGFNGKIFNRDDSGRLITNPKECNLKCIDYKTCLRLKINR